MTIIAKHIAILLCLTLAACSTTDKYSFIQSARIPDANGKYDVSEPLVLSDQLALKFASNVAAILRTKFSAARITREVSNSTQAILAGIAGAHQAFNLSASAIAVLGLSSAGIPELQGIFNAKGRAEVYSDAVRLIEEAQVEYLAHNQQPSDSFLTQNGVTLFQRVTASVHVVEKTLAGRLPTLKDMQQATEPMSDIGAMRTTPGLAVNNVPANGPAPAVIDQESREARIASFRQAVREPRTGAPAPPPVEIASGLPSIEEMRASITKLSAKDTQGPNAVIFGEILKDNEMDPETLPGKSLATKLLEGYKRNSSKRQAVSKAVQAALK